MFCGDDNVFIIIYMYKDNAIITRRLAGPGFCDENNIIDGAAGTAPIKTS